MTSWLFLGIVGDGGKDIASVTDNDSVWPAKGISQSDRPLTRMEEKGLRAGKQGEPNEEELERKDGSIRQAPGIRSYDWGSIGNRCLVSESTA